MSAVAYWLWCLAPMCDIAGSSLQRIGLVAIYKCAAFCEVVDCAFATKRPLGTVSEKNGIYSRFRVSTI